MKKTKNLELFWFFAFLQLRLPSKNQKKTRCFFVFKNLNQKKTKKLKENQKKNIFWPETKTSPKSFGFLVFWFSRGFVKILFCWKRRVLLKEEEFLRLYTTFWKYKIDAKKKQTFKYSKKQQNSANTSKFWESMGLGGGGVPYIYILYKSLVFSLSASKDQAVSPLRFVMEIQQGVDIVFLRFFSKG